MVRGTVEETLNALLDAEADRLCNAQRYERSEARRDTRAGHYERGLQTKAGEVRLRVISRHTNRPASAGWDAFVAAPGVKARNKVIEQRGRRHSYHDADHKLRPVIGA